MLGRILIGSSSLTAALMLACAPAYAASTVYADGAYAGTVVQSSPSPYSGSIAFDINGATLSGLRFKVSMKCDDLYWAKVASPPSSLQVGVTPDGKFSYSGTVSGTDVQLSGQVRGGNVVGTFFESFHTSSSSVCAMSAPAPFSASNVKASGARSKASRHASSGHATHRPSSGHSTHRHASSAHPAHRHRPAAHGRRHRRGILVNSGL